MADIADIKNFFTEMGDFHGDRVNAQEEDQRYYDDEFPVSIVQPFHVIRTGSPARVVDSIVSHIESSNPRVLRNPRKNTEGARKSAMKVSQLLQAWADAIIPEIIESAHNAVLRGEGIFQVEFNSEAYEGGSYQYKGDSLPIIVTSPDPLTVFCFPYDTLLPAKVAKIYEINATMVSDTYPHWQNPKKGRAVKHSVKYQAFWDNETRYFEAAKQSLLDDTMNPQKNTLGFCPFVHFYSGWGKRMADGNPVSLAVGRLRRLRGLLKEECETVSRIDSIIGLYSNPIYKVSQIDASAKLDSRSRRELEETVIGPGAVLVEPFGWKSELYIPQLDLNPVFAHLGEIRGRLGLENPPILSGLASGSAISGRREDIEFGHIQKRFRYLIQNLQLAIAAVLSRGLQILDTQPKSLPVTVRGTVVEDGEKITREFTITKEDIDGYYDCVVELNPDEALEDDRNFMKYRMLVNEGRISWKKFLMEGLKLSDNDADDVIAESMAEQAMMTDPFMKAALTQEAIERMGMERFLKKAQENEQLQQKYGEEFKKAQANLQPRIRPSEATNPAALGTARQLLGGETPVGMRESPNV